MYAIQNIRTGKFVWGTDYGYGIGFNRQKTSLDQMVTFDCLRYAKADFIHRQCGKDYRIVRVKRPEVERVIDFDTPDGYDPYVLEEPPEK